MNNQEILTKVIEKAIDGGWKIQTTGFTFPDLLAQSLTTHPTRSQLYGVIFNHNFAKALWGEDTNRLWKCPSCGYSFEYYKNNETEKYCPNDGRKVQDVTEPRPIWEQKYANHLQQMVIADDPIKYLGENI